MNTFLFLSASLLVVQAFALTSSVPAENQNYKAVVQIAIPAFDSDGSDVTGYCNGTLISKNTLITAAHCVVNSHLFSGRPLKIEVGEYRFKETPQGIVRLGYFPFLRHATAVQIQLRPGVNPTSPPNRISPENDYAIVKLQNEIPVPEGFVFPKVWNLNLTSAQVSQAFVVTVNQIAYISSINTKQTATLNQIQFLGNSAKSTSVSRVEEGDSGAPLFAVIQGQTYLVGVVKGRAQTAFSNWDVFAVWSQRLVTQAF